MRDNRSLLLLVVCAVLILTWVYHLYDKSTYSKKAKEILVKDTAAVTAAITDSLKNFFLNELKDLNPEKIYIDTANKKLTSLIFGIDSLKNKANAILKKNMLTAQDWNQVRDITEKTRQLIDSANFHIYLSTEVKTQPESLRINFNSKTINLPKNNKSLNNENTESIRSFNETPAFNASDIKFLATPIQTDQKNTEAISMENAEKFLVSFNVRNSTDFDNAEIMVVITEPSGKTLIPEVWDAGSFETKSEGRKAYTRRVKFEYKKAEAKRLSFSIVPERFEKGTYKLFLYNNGIRIGNANCKIV